MVPTLIGPRPTRVLLAVLQVHRRDGRATVRDVADHAGLSLSATYSQLGNLRRLGLVSWQDGRSGTLRPMVRRVA